MEETNQIANKNKTWIVAAIIIAGAIIAAALIISNGGNSAGKSGIDSQNGEGAGIQEVSLDNITEVSDKDHIRGSLDAEVIIVEYSDFECPFCQRFHPTMKQIMDEYGADGQVAWVYRHFPLDQLHPRNARKTAIASECATEQGGNKAFWGFTDRYFELSPANDQTNTDIIFPQIISELGLDQTAFNRCLSSGKYDQDVQDDVDNAVATGGQGTPWSIVVTKNGQKFPLSGAQPYNAVKQLIEVALSSN